MNKKYPAHVALKKKNGDYKSEAELDAEAKLPPPKKLYDVKVEVLLPATLTYRVLADNPEQAIELTKTMQPTGVRHQLARKRSLKAIVLDAGSTMIRLTKTFIN